MAYRSKEAKWFDDPSWHLAFAQDLISTDYGDAVDFNTKSKDLVKYGQSDFIGTSSFTDIWGFAADEVRPTDNTIDTVSSSSASDTGLMVLEGHTTPDSGVTCEFIVQTVQLNGQTPVTLDTPLFRATTSFLDLDETDDLVGDVYFYESGGTVTAGVPQVQADIHLLVEGSAGENRSRKCLTTISDKDYWVIIGIGFGVTEKTDATAEFELRRSKLGKVYISETIDIPCSRASGGLLATLPTPIIIPPNSDVKVVAKAGGNGTSVEASIWGVLATRKEVL